MTQEELKKQYEKCCDLASELACKLHEISEQYENASQEWNEVQNLAVYATGIFQSCAHYYASL